MENRLQTTFIPRRPVVNPEGGIHQKKPLGLFGLIGIMVLILAILALGGVYWFKSYLTKQNELKDQQVKEAIKSVEPELTKELTLLKIRMDVGKQLLAKHNAFSLLLYLLGLNTAQTIQFTDFGYQTSADKKITLTMKGEALSYSSIAFQSDIFSRIEQFKNPIFSNLTLTDSGRITFSTKVELDPTAVTYKKLVEGLSFPPETSVPATLPAGNAQTSTSTGTTTPSS